MDSQQFGSNGTGGEQRREAVLTKVKELVAQVLSIDVAGVHPSSVLLDLGAQSFDFVDLAFRIEQVYGIELPRSFLIPDIYTVEALVSAIVDVLAQTPVTAAPTAPQPTAGPEVS